MTPEPTLDQVLAVIGRIAGDHRSPADAGPDTLLMEGGFWLDSVHLLETVIACEETFGVVFDPALDFSDRTLITVGTLWDLIRAKQAR
jgi:acyl carrier protein